MDARVFTDKLIKPDEQLIASALGNNMVYWSELIQYLSENHKDVTLEWKYYADAKSWLLPVAIKKKNICWITVVENTFRMSFWFGKKVEGIIEKSNLPENIMKEYRRAKQNKMGRGITIVIDSQSDLEDALKLLDFKRGLK